MLIEWRNQVVGNTIKAVTWNNYVRHLKALYNFAIAQGLLCMSSNPFNHLFIRESRRKRKLIPVSSCIKSIIFYIIISSYLVF